MSATSKDPADFKEPIRERGVLLSVRRTIPRGEIGPPQKIMTSQIEDSMVKNNPENAVARAQSTEDQLRAETRHFAGSLQRSMGVFTAGLPTGAGASLRNGAGALDTGASLCSPRQKKDRPREVHFGDAIGKELQNLYDDLVAQPIPERFLNLLNQLEKNVVSSGLSSSAPGEKE
jgi:hypothetical protein